MEKEWLIIEAVCQPKRILLTNLNIPGAWRQASKACKIFTFYAKFLAACVQRFFWVLRSTRSSEFCRIQTVDLAWFGLIWRARDRSLSRCIFLWIWQRLIHLGWGQAGERYHRQISGFGAGASDTKVRECFQHVLRLDGLMYVSWSFMIIHDLLSNVVNRSSNNILNDGLSRYSLGTTCWEISPGHTTQRSAGFASGRCALAKL